MATSAADSSRAMKNAPKQKSVFLIFLRLLYEEYWGFIWAAAWGLVCILGGSALVYYELGNVAPLDAYGRGASAAGLTFF